MRRVFWLRAIFLAFLTLAVGGATLETAYSANGKFRVIVEDDPSSVNQLAATMAAIDGSSDTAQWITKVPIFRPPAFAAPPIFVSDRGDFFVRPSGPNEVTLYRKGPHAKLATRTSRFQPIVYDQFPGVEDVRGVETLRLWNYSYFRWDAYKTVDGSEFRAAPEDIARWNETTRREIVAKLNAYKGAELARRASRLAGPIARLTQLGRTNVALPTTVDYQFLATARSPGDRKWIEDLARNANGARLRGVFSVATPDQSPDHYEVQNTDFQRAFGDMLLGYWDKKVNEPYVDWVSSADAERFTLGRVKGVVRLPMPMPIYRSATQATRLHIRLISDDRSGTGEERIAATIGYERAVSRKRVYDVKFAFTTVLPGTYRLKAIWDKRAPLTDTNSAGPGDYESLMSAPFSVEAGTVVTNVILDCTNRVAGGETYYAADEAFAANWVANNPPAPVFKMPRME